MDESPHAPDRDVTNRGWRTPLRLLLIVALSTLAVEVGIMLLFEHLPAMDRLTASLLDGILLVALVFPILYLFMFRPLRTHNAALKAAEQSLKAQRDELEKLVDSRTAELHDSEEKLVEAQRISHIGSWEHSVPAGMGYWSDETYRILGLSRASIQPGRDALLQSVHPEDRARVAITIDQIPVDKKPNHAEFRVVRTDGSIRHVHARAEIMPNGSDRMQKVFGTLQDITEQKATEERINFLAYYDPLTGLPNRTLMHDRIASAMAVARRHNARLALLSLNIDRMKSINDSFGLGAGDLLLKNFAARLRDCVREEDSIARLGGDEFLILLQDLSDNETASHTAQRILDGMQEAFLADGHQVFVTCSIGISIFPDHGTDPATLIKNANAAMYFTKTSDRGTFRLFAPEMNALSAERLLMESELRRALKNDELVLHYQPQRSLSSNALVGFEALVRWNHPQQGLILPAQFIPVAEDAGLIAQIGEQVMRKACFQARQWQQQGLTIVPVAVNVSSVQFRQNGFLESVEAALRDSGLDLAYLELELTESLLLSNADVVLDVLGALKRMGVKLLIDDFGTGYSSLSYLKRLPVHKLKIDQSFVRGLPASQDDVAIVRAIISIAGNLHMKVIAEGVETDAQRAFLHAHGCDEAQGYLYSKPLPPEAAAELLAQRMGPAAGRPPT